MVDSSSPRVFSVIYFRPGDSGEDYAADWNWLVEGRWTISSKPRNEAPHWFYRGELDEYGREGILKKFGLFDWEEEFPLNRLRLMGPPFLIIERKKKEKLHSLATIMVHSDRLGNRVPAEQCA